MKKKILVFDKLTITNLIFFFIFYFLGFEIYYISIKTNLRKLYILKKLKKFGIKWFNFEDFDNDEIYSNKVQLSKLFCDNFTDEVSKQIWSTNLKEVFFNRHHLSACLNYKIKEKSNEIIELLEVAKILGKNKQSFVWTKNSELFNQINNKLYGIKNINFFINLDWIKIITTFLQKIIHVFGNGIKISNILKPKVLNPNNSSTDFRSNSNVAFFPHKGMYTQNLLKDYFYSNNKKSIFFKKNILHIEWDPTDVKINSKLFYYRNNIPLIFWCDLNKKKESVIEIFKFILKMIPIVLILKKRGLVTFFFISAFQIIHAKKKLLTLKNIKYLLVGYDNLFPPEISVACKLIDVKTIALQERVIVPNWVHKMIFDYYFVMGEKSLKTIKRRMNKTIINLISINQQKIKKYKIKKYKLKKSNFDYKCLVIDMNSLPKKYWFDNGRSLNNWRSNKKFYTEIIYLAKKYKNILFMIKSKNYLWIKNPEFRNIYKDMNKTNNIKILSNQRFWTPVRSVINSDFAIARYSSLADEFLNLNKPIILYDLKGYPQRFFDYGQKIVSYNIIQVEDKINKLIKNFTKFNKNLNVDRRKLFFSNKNISLNSNLDKILNLN